MGVYTLTPQIHNGDLFFKLNTTNKTSLITDVYNGNDITFMNQETGCLFDFSGLWVIKILDSPLDVSNIMKYFADESNIVHKHIIAAGQYSRLSNIVIFNNKVISLHSGFQPSKEDYDSLYKVFSCPKDRIPEELHKCDVSGVDAHIINNNRACVSYKYVSNDLYEIDNERVNLRIVTTEGGRFSCNLNRILDDACRFYPQKVYANYFYTNQKGVHVLQDKLVDNNYDHVARIPLHIEDFKTLQKLFSMKSSIVQTETLSSQEDYDVVKLFDGHVAVTVLKEKKLSRISRTKNSREISTLQSYLLSIYISMSLLNDLITPEGCYLNVFNFPFIYEYNRYVAAPPFDVMPQEAYFILDKTKLSILTNNLINGYKQGKVSVTQIGGGVSPITDFVYAQIRSANQCSMWLASLGNNEVRYKKQNIGGLARDTKKGMDINKKILGLDYLLSLVYSKDCKRLDTRMNRNRWYPDSNYEKLLEQDKKLFYDLNILPNKARNEFMENHIREISGFEIRLKEIYTLSEQSLLLLDTGFKTFDTLSDMCSWWLSMLPLFRQLANRDKYTEYEFKLLDALLDNTAYIVSQLIEQLQED